MWISVPRCDRFIPEQTALRLFEWNVGGSQSWFERVQRRRNSRAACCPGRSLFTTLSELLFLPSSLAYISF
jgi:hypothetical protein